MNISIRSEIGKLQGVIIHAPGREVENMTPENATRALYSDILNLSVAGREYAQFKGVLDKLTHTYQVEDLLADILTRDKIREELVEKICHFENRPDVQEYLMDITPQQVARQLIQGVVEEKDTLSKYLSKERYSLRPLHNFFFTRDASMVISDKVLIARMANKIRERESFIMESIFQYHEIFKATIVNPLQKNHLNYRATLEGGDLLVAREDIWILGLGSRTNAQGIDFIIQSLMDQGVTKRHFIVQELPHDPESFIHLDMVFSILDRDECMVYAPLILKTNRYQSLHITVEHGAVSRIEETENILTVLDKLGMPLKPIFCGGNKNHWIQERGQWHSGANLFAVGPGKLIGYARNVYTLEELSKDGYEILRAKDVIRGKSDPAAYQKYVIGLDGSELPRGGGGARCMTLPVCREGI